MHNSIVNTYALATMIMHNVGLVPVAAPTTRLTAMDACVIGRQCIQLSMSMSVVLVPVWLSCVPNEAVRAVLLDDPENNIFCNLLHSFIKLIELDTHC